MNFLFLIVLIFCMVYFVKWIYEKVFPKIENLVVKKSGIIGAGRGVFAEKNYKKGEIIENCPYVHDNINNINGKLVNYYMDGTSLNKNHVIIPFGLCPIYNHSNNSNTHYEFGNMESLNVIADRDIKEGEELTFDYGEEWWKKRQ